MIVNISSDSLMNAQSNKRNGYIGMQLVTHLGVALVDGMCDSLHKMMSHTPVRIGVAKVATLSFTGNAMQNAQ